MDTQTALTLRRLLDERPVAALATLHRGEPAVSMTPFVLPAGRTELLIHVSALATHSADMRAHARVAVLVMGEVDARGAGRDAAGAEPDAQARAAASPQALPRVSLQAEARFIARDTAEHAEAAAAYLARFPDAAITFELADFALVALRPLSARLVAGFGRAYSLVGEGLDAWLRGATDAG